MNNLFSHSEVNAPKLLGGGTGVCVRIGNFLRYEDWHSELPDQTCGEYSTTTSMSDRTALAAGLGGIAAAFDLVTHQRSPLLGDQVRAFFRPRLRWRVNR